MAKKSAYARITVAFDLRNENHKKVYDGFFRLKDLIETQQGKKDLSNSDALYRMLYHLNETVVDADFVRPPEYYEIPERIDSLQASMAHELKALRQQIVILQSMISNIQVAPSYQEPQEKPRQSLYQSKTVTRKTYGEDDE